MSPFVELTFEGPLARLTIKRANKLNALDRAMVDALADAARSSAFSLLARFIVRRARGPSNVSSTKGLIEAVPRLGGV